MTPAHHRHPAQRQLVGVIVSVEERAQRGRSAEPRPPAREFAVSLALYTDRQSRPLGIELPLTFPKAGNYQPQVGDRFMVSAHPVEA